MMFMRRDGRGEVPGGLNYTMYSVADMHDGLQQETAVIILHRMAANLLHNSSTTILILKYMHIFYTL